MKLVKIFKSLVKKLPGGQSKFLEIASWIFARETWSCLCFTKIANKPLLQPYSLLFKLFDNIYYVSEIITWGPVEVS